MTTLTEHRKYHLTQSAFYLGLFLREWNRTAVRDAVYATASLIGRDVYPMPDAKVSLRRIDDLFRRLVWGIENTNAEVVNETVDRMAVAAGLV
jgi:hypothetical protein